jgi:predicted RNA-binding Zn ribbon-like protein
MNMTPHTHTVGLEVALDFLNTLELVRGTPLDHFATAGQAVAWLSEHGLVHAEALGLAADEAALARVRRTRVALRELAEATYERRRPSAEALAEINRALRTREVLEIVPADEGLRLDHRHVGDPLDDALARLAEPLVREITGGRPERLRACANEGCRWVFYDETPTGRRRWCDMAVCGNRAKAARHRARVKGTPETPRQLGG